MTLDPSGGLNIECLELGELLTNCYVLTAGGVCWIVDPGLSPEPLVDHLRRNGLSPERILLTHGHCDHIAGLAAVKEAFPGALVTAPAGDAGMLTDPVANLSLPFGLRITAVAADRTVSPGEELAMGPLTWRVLDAAGHTPGGVAYYCPAAEVVISGDALFAEGIGRTDIPGADESQLLRNIREGLLTLPGPTRVLPGHGPATTIEHERKHNPFLAG